MRTVAVINSAVQLRGSPDWLLAARMKIHLHTEQDATNKVSAISFPLFERDGSAEEAARRDSGHLLAELLAA